MEKYNGWKNRETWLVNMYLGETLEALRETLEAEELQNMSASDLKDWAVEILAPNFETMSFFEKDAVTTVLDEVDWGEILEAAIR
jgi:hypothetical protein